MVNPYDIILMPWITEKTLEARRVADLENNYRENNNRIEFIVRRESTKKQIRDAVEMLAYSMTLPYVKSARPTKTASASGEKATPAVSPKWSSVCLTSNPDLVS